MHIALGSDHRGFQLKDKILHYLKDTGYNYTDCGCYDTNPVDYPDFASRVTQKITTGEADSGILICGSGIGMSIAANKSRGIRAALCCNRELTFRARRHNNANVLCLGSDFTDDESAVEIVKVFLTTEFEGGRHQTRLEKISKIESI